MNADETLLTPTSAPGVSDDVVLDAVLNTPTNCNDSVVDIGRAALSGSDDTTSVVHEDVVTSGNSDVNGLLGKTGQVVSGAVSLTVGRNSSDSLGGVVGAGLVHGSVGVIRLLHGLVVLEPVVRPEVPTTIAALVASRAGAVNKLLLRHDDHSVALNGPGGLDSLDGGESPARTARSLILDGGAVASIAMVVGGGEVRDINVRNGLSEVGLGHVLKTKETFLLLNSPVREQVVAGSVGGVGVGVGALDVLFDSSVVLLTEVELLNGGVHLVIGGDVAHEVVIDLLHHGGGSESSETGDGGE